MMRMILELSWLWKFLSVFAAIAFVLAAALIGVGSYGNYWSAGPNSNTNGCNLNFNSSNVNPQNTNYRAYGFSVRPVSALT